MNPNEPENPESPESSRQEHEGQQEARLTALLLGELSESEAAELRQRMAADPDLQRLHEQLEKTIGLVREIASVPEQAESPAPAEALQLSAERRAALLGAFKVIRLSPEEFARNREQRRVKRRDLALVAAMIIGLMAVAGTLTGLMTTQESSTMLGRALTRSVSGSRSSVYFDANGSSWEFAREEASRPALLSADNGPARGATPVKVLEGGRQSGRTLNESKALGEGIANEGDVARSDSSRRNVQLALPKKIEDTLVRGEGIIAQASPELTLWDTRGQALPFGDRNVNGDVVVAGTTTPRTPGASDTDGRGRGDISGFTRLDDLTESERKSSEVSSVGGSRSGKKLDSIRINVGPLDSLPLAQVLESLSQDIKRNDPEGKGLNIIVSDNTAPAEPPSIVDPATGLPPRSLKSESVDLTGVTVKLPEGRTDLSVRDALDQIVKSSETPLTYSVENYGIVVQRKPVSATNEGAPTTAAKPDENEVLAADFIKFQDADIASVLKAYQELTGRTVLKPASLPEAKISIQTPNPLTRKEAVQALESALSRNQISMVPQGDKFTKALAPADAGTAGAIFYKGSVPNLPNQNFQSNFDTTKSQDFSDLQPSVDPSTGLPAKILDDDGLKQQNQQGQATQLHTRWYKIDPEKFVNGANGVSTFDFGGSANRGFGADIGGPMIGGMGGGGGAGAPASGRRAGGGGLSGTSGPGPAAPVPGGAVVPPELNYNPPPADSPQWRSLADGFEAKVAEKKEASGINEFGNIATRGLQSTVSNPSGENDREGVGIAKVLEQRFDVAAKAGEAESRDKVRQIEDGWSKPVARTATPAPIVAAPTTGDSTAPAPATLFVTPGGLPQPGGTKPTPTTGSTTLESFAADGRAVATKSFDSRFKSEFQTKDNLAGLGTQPAPAITPPPAIALPAMPTEPAPRQNAAELSKSKMERKPDATEKSGDIDELQMLSEVKRHVAGTTTPAPAEKPTAPDAAVVVSDLNLGGIVVDSEALDAFRSKAKTPVQIDRTLRAGAAVADQKSEKRPAGVGDEYVFSLAGNGQLPTGTHGVSGTNYAYTANAVGYADLAPTQRRSLGYALDADIGGPMFNATGYWAESPVQIIETAKPSSGKNPSLWGTIRNAFGNENNEATTRLQFSAASPRETGLAPTAAFDPHWVTTEAEKIESKTVLDGVIQKLNLNETWAGRFGGGQALTKDETYKRLRGMIDVRQDGERGELDIKVKGANSEESARIANAVAEAYRDRRQEETVLRESQAQQLHNGRVALDRAQTASAKQVVESEPPPPPRKPAPDAPVPQPEIVTTENAYSTFSLNVSDVSFKLAAASLEKGQMPEATSVRTEEFINAFDYRDPEPTGRQRLAFQWERARYPFAHNRDLVRFSVKTAASGRQAGRPLNLVLLLDNSGSMERADRLRIRQECLRVLAGQLRPEDRVSVVAFARTPRLWVDGLSGAQAGELSQRVGNLSPEGGTNLEEAMNLAYQTARRHFQANGINRVVLLTDGAANLGNVDPVSLKTRVESNRQQGVALDCFGIGWDGYNDDLLETLSRNGDGRYGFINTPEAALTEFAGQLAGALRVAASDVKVQVQFNPARVTAYRQMGYAKHQLKKEQFRDNTVDAAEIGAAEAGNALYVVEVNPRGEGPLGVVRVRFKIPGTTEYREQEWTLSYDGPAKSFEQGPGALRLAGVAAAFSEWLVASPYAAEVTPSQLTGYLRSVLGMIPSDPRPKQLEAMLRQAGSLAGK